MTVVTSMFGQMEGTWVWAQAMLRNGYKVRRAAWYLESMPIHIIQSRFIYMTLLGSPVRGEKYSRRLYGQPDHDWTPHAIDQAATDWEIV